MCARHHLLVFLLYMTKYNDIQYGSFLYRARSAPVVKCLTRDRGVAGFGLAGVAALCP